MIEARALTRRFSGGVLAVDALSLSVRTGEVVGLLGPNGAGKSTTIRMLTGYLAPTAGSSRLAGVDVQREPVRAQRALGYLPEGSPLYAEMTPRAILRFVASVRGLRGRARTSAVDRAIARARIASVADRAVETLSKGYRRRVGLAQAIVHEPPVLILDEPTDGLDPNQKRAVRALVAELREQAAVIISTHLLEEVGTLCTRTGVIARGRLVFDGSPEQLHALDPARGTVTLTVRTTADDAPVRGERWRGLFADLAGAGAIDSEAGPEASLVRVTIRPKPDASERERTALAPLASARARERGLAIESLAVEPGRLDEVFRQLTERANATPGPERAA
ncbi:MAG: ABC transporter ATP-binding protein [Phycisphaerales bacterium]|nr:MAG: ABC transporter ATP-binding protein [Phycisphaerales bacterium]